MFWIDYSIESFPDGSFRVVGDTPSELLDKGLYSPGDVFIVDKNGILRKQEGLQKMLMQFEKDPSLWT